MTAAGRTFAGEARPPLRFLLPSALRMRKE